MNNSDDIHISLKLMQGHDAFYETYPLVTQMNAELEEPVFRHLQDKMIEEGYQCIGAYDQGNVLRGICGFWITHRFYCGKSLRIDNIVVCNAMRNLKIGEALLEWIDNHAKAQECCAIALDAYVENKRSHDFYLKHDLSIVGVHFMKVLGED